jgi:hypothetical protein
MTEPGAALDGHALAACYEALRQDVVALDGRGRTMHGRALLVFKGMAAWMKGMGEVPLPSPRPAATTTMRLSAGIEQTLVNIVASMALATALEGIA